jgi:hypothetical protein
VASADEPKEWPSRVAKRRALPSLSRICQGRALLKATPSLSWR